VETLVKRTPEGLAINCPSDLFRMSREELRAELAHSLDRTASELVRLAWIVRLLEERGEDLTDLKLDLVPYLRLIAYGQLSPGLVVRYGHSGALMKVARSLPMPDQDRLARGERVPMVVRKPDGGFDQQMADPALMSPRQIAQVFAAGRVRSTEEQILVLRDQPAKPAKRKKETVGRITITPVGDGIIVKGTFIPKSDLVEALAMMARPDESDDEPDDSPGRKPVVVQLTEQQHARLKDAADRGSTKMATLARRALAAYDLI
jgi:hypothetical protein